MSPTQRTLAKLRAEGWMCGIVEHFNPHVKIRQDLFGFIDLICVRGDMTLAVQTTSGDHVADHVEKIRGLPAARTWASSIFRQIVVMGWRKVGPRGKRKLWECREVLVEFSAVAPLL